MLNHNFLYHDKNNLIVIWQAKAACTTVVKMYFEEENLLDIALTHSTWIHVYRQEHTKNNNKINNSVLSDPNSKFIQFVVNPYRRAVSSYIHMMKTKYAGIENTNICFSEFLDRLINKKIKNNIHHDQQTFYLDKNIEYIKWKILNQDYLK